MNLIAWEWIFLGYFFFFGSRSIFLISKLNFTVFQMNHCYCQTHVCSFVYNENENIIIDCLCECHYIKYQNFLYHKNLKIAMNFPKNEIQHLISPAGPTTLPRLEAQNVSLWYAHGGEGSLGYNSQGHHGVQSYRTPSWSIENFKNLIAISLLITGVIQF